MRIGSALLVLCILFCLTQAQWEPDVRVTNDPGNSFLCGQQCLVALGDTLHVVFVDDRSGDFNVYYTRSLDAGANWDSAVRVSPGDSNRIFGATIAAAGADVHVVWEGPGNGSLWYRHSTDGGTTWKPETALVESPRGCGTPVLAADGDHVGLVWGDGRDGSYNGELYYKQSDDAGLNWTADTRLTTDQQDSVLDKEASLVVRGSHRYIVWTRMHWRTYVPQVWFMRSTDGGATWQPRVHITDDTTRQEQPMVAAAGNSVHVCWYDGRPETSGIYYRRSSDNGASWSMEQCLTDSTHGSDHPAIAAAGANVHVAFRANYSGQLVANYRGSTDNGQTWSPDTTLSSLAGMGTANIAAAGTRAHIMLYDNRDGNFEIYSKRNMTAGAVMETPGAEVRTPSRGATIVRGVLSLSAASRQNVVCRAELLGINGRKVLDLHAGPNDVSRLAPGVYFALPGGTDAGRRIIAR